MRLSDSGRMLCELVRIPYTAATLPPNETSAGAVVTIAVPYAELDAKCVRANTNERICDVKSSKQFSVFFFVVVARDIELYLGSACRVCGARAVLHALRLWRF